MDQPLRPGAEAGAGGHGTGGKAHPAVGDYVIAEWPDDDSNAVIHSVFPRKSCFIRKAAGADKQEQVVASNIDTVFLCMSLNNDFNIRRIERYLALAHDSGATPVIVLTKADLCDDRESKLAEIRCIAFDVDILAVSSMNNDYDALMKYIKPGYTIAFLGSSGVGKSTLINKLVGSESTICNPPFMVQAIAAVFFVLSYLSGHGKKCKQTPQQELPQKEFKTVPEGQKEGCRLTIFQS